MVYIKLSIQQSLESQLAGGRPVGHLLVRVAKELGVSERGTWTQDLQTTTLILVYRGDLGLIVRNRTFV